MATEFRLTIELGNEAMTSHGDVSRALRALSQHGELHASDEGKIRDDNGNTVGSWTFI